MFQDLKIFFTFNSTDYTGDTETENVYCSRHQRQRVLKHAPEYCHTKSSQKAVTAHFSSEEYKAFRFCRAE